MVPSCPKAGRIRQISLLIPPPPTIMSTYTDWGNLKIVSCEAWLNGAGPGSSTVFQWNGRVGGVHFYLTPLLPP